MRNEIPYKTVRRILKNYIEGEVPHTGVKSVQHLLDEICINVATASNIEYQNHNQLRQIHSLPKHKRIPESILISLCNELYKQLKCFNDGEIAQHSRDTILSKANIEVV